MPRETGKSWQRKSFHSWKPITRRRDFRLRAIQNRGHHVRGACLLAPFPKALKDPGQFVKKFAEKKFKEKVKKVEDKIKDPIGSTVEDILNPGGIIE
ncbi:hypothetical protein C9413_26570 [Rhizobium sp. SEMIA 4085]|uniref:hypothetical protein n=1 Tax=Rhizobium TaxID=379 RepID=UPI001063D2F4|nr:MULTISPECIES: hypothetical protein [Rhizobium]NNH32876.1 hypothetical protein [Rhizobium sp. SEMIA 4085]TDW16871.1 hypothetical protein EV128_1319 [Rhizobium azibense]